MEPVPTLPTLDAVGREAFAGNLWIQERLDAEPLRFAVDGGQFRFADATRTFGQGRVPPRYRVAVRAVREGFDLGAFFKAADDPAAYTFVCDATVHRHLPYDWERLPPAVGVEVHDAAADRWLSPDAAARVYERLGLASLNTFERELPARHFYPDRYETPDSEWYDGPPAGLLVRDKNGTRACRYYPTYDPDATPETDRRDPETLVEAYVTDERIARVAATLDSAAGSFETLFERVLEAVFRETPAVVEGEDLRAFRSAAAERVRRWQG
jgi:hypothetical protein